MKTMANFASTEAAWTNYFTAHNDKWENNEYQEHLQVSFGSAIIFCNWPYNIIKRAIYLQSNEKPNFYDYLYCSADTPSKHKK